MLKIMLQMLKCYSSSYRIIIVIVKVKENIIVKVKDNVIVIVIVLESSYYILNSPNFYNFNFQSGI